MTELKHGVWLHNGTALTIGDAVDAARAAEASGWDGVFVSDSPWEGYSDPWDTLGACAAVTERITLGTWVIPLPQYDPMRAAHAAASIDQLSGGRMLLGVGLGVRDEYEMYHGGYDGPRLGRRYDEASGSSTASGRTRPSRAGASSSGSAIHGSRSAPCRPRGSPS